MRLDIGLLGIWFRLMQKCPKVKETPQSQSGSCAFEGKTLLKTLLELIENNSEDNHQTGNDLLPKLLNTQQHKPIGENANHERANDGSPYRSPAACEGRSA